MTASMPCRRLSTPRVTGMPPPPLQITMAPSPTRVRMADSSTMAFGSGDNRTASPGRSVLSDLPAMRGGDSFALVEGVGGADELGRMLERRVIGCDQGPADQAQDLVAGECIGE